MEELLVLSVLPPAACLLEGSGESDGAAHRAPWSWSRAQGAGPLTPRALSTGSGHRARSSAGRPRSGTAQFSVPESRRRSSARSSPSSGVANLALGDHPVAELSAVACVMVGQRDGGIEHGGGIGHGGQRRLLGVHDDLQDVGCRAHSPLTAMIARSARPRRATVTFRVVSAAVLAVLWMARSYWRAVSIVSHRANR